MSDVTTAPVPKNVIKDPPTSRQDKKVPDPEFNAAGTRQGNATAPDPRPEVENPGASTGYAPSDSLSGGLESSRTTITQTSDVVLDNTLFFAARNMETVINSATTAMRAAEEMTQTAVEYGQRNLEHFSAIIRDLSEVRSINDLVTVHHDHMRAVVDDLIEETTRISQHFTKHMGELVDTVVKQDQVPTARSRTA